MRLFAHDGSTGTSLLSILRMFYCFSNRCESGYTVTVALRRDSCTRPRCVSEGRRFLVQGDATEGQPNRHRGRRFAVAPPRCSPPLRGLVIAGDAGRGGRYGGHRGLRGLSSFSGLTEVGERPRLDRRFGHARGLKPCAELLSALGIIEATWRGDVAFDCRDVSGLAEQDRVRGASSGARARAPARQRV